MSPPLARGVCNTYVPPQTEDECCELARSRFYDEENRHSERMVRLYTKRQEEWDESNEIFVDENLALIAVRDERTKIAKAHYATAVAGYTAGFAACMGAASPTFGGGWVLCGATYLSLVAKAGVDFDRKVANAEEDYKRDNHLASDRLEDRKNATKSLYDDRLIPNEESRNESGHGVDFRGFEALLGTGKQLNQKGGSRK